MLRRAFVLVAALCVSCVALAQELPLDAHVVFALDADTNEILVNKNADQQHPIASITKLMTAMVTLDAQLPFGEEITITDDEVQHTKIGKRPTSGSLPVGTKLTRADLLLLALMNSQNRAACALARTYPGGRDAFIQAMNAKAQSLGMVNTHYVDPTGLLKDNVSTAQDLAILVRRADEYELIRDYSTLMSQTYEVKRKRAKQATFSTTNAFVRQKWDIALQKTGYTEPAGRCVVMLMTVGAKRIILIVLNAESTRARGADVMTVAHYVQTGEAVRIEPPKAKSKQVKKRKRRRHA